MSGQDLFFLFGPLTDPELCQIVIGSGQGVVPAELSGHCTAADAQGVPCLMPAPGQHVAGGIVALSAQAAARLDLYQALFGQGRAPAQLSDGRAVTIYLAQETAPRPEAFDLAHWQARTGAASRRAAQEIFVLARSHALETLRVRYGMLLAFASSQVRAASEGGAQTLRRAAKPGDVISRQQMQPYSYFFGVQVDDLQFRRFDGSLSPVVRRAGFMMADAVTVLPYDPVRDCVLLVEQFRYGAYMRGVANAWTLEPIAGRIDGSEEPVAAALREMAEEARLELRESDLRAIGGSYPSPGAISEFLYHFIAICDLPASAEGVAGLESEAEDIRSHVVPFERLMQMIQTGEAQNGPLIQSAYWLALNRAGLRPQ